MLRRVPCYGCAFCASWRDTGSKYQYHATKHRTHIHNMALLATQHNTTRHAATIPNWYSEINVTFNGVTLARTIWLPDDGPRTETCRSVFNVSICKFYKFYICAVVGIVIEWLDNMHGVTTEIVVDLVERFLAFCITWTSIALLVRVRNRNMSWARLTLSTVSQFTVFVHLCVICLIM